MESNLKKKMKNFELHYIKIFNFYLAHSVDVKLSILGRSKDNVAVTRNIESMAGPKSTRVSVCNDLT